MQEAAANASGYTWKALQELHRATVVEQHGLGRNQQARDFGRCTGEKRTFARLIAHLFRGGNL